MLSTSEVDCRCPAPSSAQVSCPHGQSIRSGLLDLVSPLTQNEAILFSGWLKITWSWTIQQKRIVTIRLYNSFLFVCLFVSQTDFYDSTLSFKQRKEWGGKNERRRAKRRLNLPVSLHLLHLSVSRQRRALCFWGIQLSVCAQKPTIDRQKGTAPWWEVWRRWRRKQPADWEWSMNHIFNTNVLLSHCSQIMQPEYFRQRVSDRKSFLQTLSPVDE